MKSPEAKHKNIGLELHGRPEIRNLAPTGFISGLFGFAFLFEDYILHGPGIVHEYTQSSNPITVKS